MKTLAVLMWFQVVITAAPEGGALNECGRAINDLCQPYRGLDAVVRCSWSIGEKLLSECRRWALDVFALHDQYLRLVTFSCNPERLNRCLDFPLSEKGGCLERLSLSKGCKAALSSYRGEVKRFEKDYRAKHGISFKQMLGANL